MVIEKMFVGDGVDDDVVEQNAVPDALTLN